MRGGKRRSARWRGPARGAGKRRARWAGRHALTGEVLHVVVIVEANPLPDAGSEPRPDFPDHRTHRRMHVRSWQRACINAGMVEVVLGIDGNQDRLSVPWMAYREQKRRTREDHAEGDKR